MSSRTNLCDPTINSGLSRKESTVFLCRIQIHWYEYEFKWILVGIVRPQSSRTPIEHRYVRCWLSWWAGFCPIPVWQTTFTYPFVLSSHFTASSSLPKKENARLQAVTIKLLAVCKVRTEPCFNLLHHADLLHIKIIITIPNNPGTCRLIISSPALVGGSLEDPVDSLYGAKRCRAHSWLRAKRWCGTAGLCSAQMYCRAGEEM